ncbi:MMPL family transporter [Mesonia mobilis]|uniref:MMPL family transporter n=1 Tax=Mesonia mobilis TaxID=369791 RepID=UPI0026F32280|nr:MMPL family transporter [Mesonia mobilis]
MHKWLFQLYQYFQSHKTLAFFGFLLLILCFVFGASQLNFQEDIQQLIPKTEASTRLQRILKTVEFTDKIVVNISSEKTHNEDSLVSYAEAFLQQLQQSPDSIYIEKIQGKVADREVQQTYDFILENLPLFLTDEDYEIIQQRIAKDSVQSSIEGVYKSLVSPSGILTKRFVLNDPFQLSSLGLTKLKSLELQTDFRIYKNFLVHKNGKNLLLLITPNSNYSDAASQANFADFLNSTVEELNKKNEVKASIFGSMLYSVANANQIKKDILFTVGIAVFILLGILIFFYRKIYIPLVLFLPTLVGGVFALAFIYLLSGEVSLISLGIGAILLGISLDYSLHILTHYRNQPNVKSLYKTITQPVIISCFTTAIAFFCLLFLNTEALADLGLFAGLSVIGSAMVALLIIPHLYRKKDSVLPQQTFLDRLGAYEFSKNKLLLGSLGLAFLVGLFFMHKVEFNNDLAQLNYQPKALIAVEKQLQALEEGENKTLYLASYGNTLNDALLTNQMLYKKLQKAKEKEAITSFSSIGGVVLSTQEQQERIEKWKNFWSVAKREKLLQQIETTSDSLGLKRNAFQGFEKLLKKDFKTLNLQDYQQVSNLFINDFIQQSSEENLVTITSSIKVPQRISADVIEKFNQEEGVLAIDRKAMNESFLGSLKEDFNELLLYSFIAVFFILIISFRNLKLTFLTLIPIAITWVLALFIMYILGIQFNVLNIIISTFIFGLGVDYSIFITSGLKYELNYKNEVLSSYKTSILLSVITTLLGMGVMIFAKHPALKSIASVSLIGIFSAVLVSFTVQPFLFRLLYRKSNA